MRVTLYVKEQCQPCRLTGMRFDKLGIPYRETPIVEHLDHIKSLGYVSAPVVEVDLGDGATVHWSGFRPSMIDQLDATR